ncbi:saccharopine dehydrogenase family protein [Arenicella xantha]|uniref:Short subunit dehydrogenase-like uncharacterized protein n=1 Tax=Arenicella xantha TaxID=644221 RepID=A0A395JP01_9GAMM|nr:saccharopine dehydrogenase NADP-binding domain-containing protein [Arenicella xantha]RBP49794.1 short subunit dehydrogenase-like uncharacterized protein [Arenicella xantha]
MAHKKANKQFDVVVLGATGFTGKWVAKYLFEQYQGTSLRWAIAGRNATKLNDVRGFIGDHKSSVVGIHADNDDEPSLRALAANTSVIISAVGPYAQHGSLLVKACAELGTHYVDLTGEVPWMRDMIDTYQDVAVGSGARIVHSCGFDSIPSDMGTYFIQREAQLRFNEYLKSVRYTLVKAKGGISGGTIASMMNIVKLAVKDKGVRKLLGNPYALNPDPSFKGGDKRDQGGVKYSRDVKMWTAPFLMAGINTRIVRRSNSLMDFRYGRDFRYSEAMATNSGVAGYLAAKGISVGIKSMAVTSVTALGRKFLGLMLPAQGDGPKVDPDKPGFYYIQFNGETRGGEPLQASLRGDGDPGYGSTSKMLAESGVCLALDALDTLGGFWTPSSAMGDKLLSRLQTKGGLTFTIDD